MHKCTKRHVHTCSPQHVHSSPKMKRTTCLSSIKWYMMEYYTAISIKILQTWELHDEILKMECLAKQARYNKILKVWIHLYSSSNTGKTKLCFGDSYLCCEIVWKGKKVNILKSAQRNHWVEEGFMTEEARWGVVSGGGCVLLFECESEKCSVCKDSLGRTPISYVLF
jgi:hypothetical protein